MVSSSHSQVHRNLKLRTWKKFLQDMPTRGPAEITKFLNSSCNRPLVIQHLYDCVPLPLCGVDPEALQLNILQHRHSHFYTFLGRKSENIKASLSAMCALLLRACHDSGGRWLTAVQHSWDRMPARYDNQPTFWTMVAGCEFHNP